MSLNDVCSYEFFSESAIEAETTKPQRSDTVKYIALRLKEIEMSLNHINNSLKN